MVDESWVVRFYFDTQNSDRDAAKMANRLAEISKLMRQLGQDTKYIDQAVRSLSKMATSSETMSKKEIAANKQRIDSTQALNQQLYDQAQAYSRLQAAQKVVVDRQREQDKAAREAAASQRQFENSLVRTRYALYDVSNGLAIVGAGLLLVAGSTLKMGIEFERQFADVERTARVSGDAINVLRSNIIDLGQAIPASFGDINKIATLAGQLGVPASQVAAFTSVVARFSATTNMSSEEAAKAFGRMRSLLPDVADGSVTLEQLASSILRVGTNSVATESDITKIATQISSMAGYAGLTSDQLIGLSAALASVGTQPELARGTVTRLFTLMGKAVSDSGAQLEAFAKIAGVSASEFSSAWGTDKFGSILRSFVGGLNNIQTSGGDVVKTLNNLGTTSVRDVPALTRLATAFSSTGVAGGLLAETMRDASNGLIDSSELANQYGIIAETVAAKIDVLVNNFQALLTTIGQGGGVFGGALDVLNGILETLTDIAANPVTGFFLQVGIVITGLTGILAVMGAVLVRGLASWYALQTAMISTAATGGVVGFSFARLNSELVAVGVSSRVAAAGINGLRLGIVGAAVGIAAFSAVPILNAANDGVRALKGWGDELDSLQKRVSDPNFFGSGESAIATYQRWLSGGLGGEAMFNLSQFFTGAGTGTAFAQEIAKFDDALSSLAQGGNIGEVQKRIDQLGLSQSELKSILPDTYKQLELLGQQSGVSASQVLQMAEDTDTAAAAQEQLAASLGMTTDELDNYAKAIASGSGKFTDFKTIMDEIRSSNEDWARSMSEATYGNENSWQEWYDGSSVSIESFMQKLDESITNQSTWADNLAELAGRGASSFVSQMAALGPQSSQIVADATKLSPEQLTELENNSKLAAFLASDAFAQEFINQTPGLMEAYRNGGIDAVRAMIEGAGSVTPEAAVAVTKDIKDIADEYWKRSPLSLQIETDSATQRMTNWLLENDGKKLTVWVDTVGPIGSAGSLNLPAIPKANGGPIVGPGTGTSDDVLIAASNGEYMMRAAAVRKYGYGLFDALNRGVAKFATGGPIGGSPSSGGFAGMGIVELGPKSLGAVRAIANQEVRAVLSSSAEQMAGYVNDGNSKMAWRGA